MGFQDYVKSMPLFQHFQNFPLKWRLLVAIQAVVSVGVLACTIRRDRKGDSEKFQAKKDAVAQVVNVYNDPCALDAAAVAVADVRRLAAPTRALRGWVVREGHVSRCRSSSTTAAAASVHSAFNGQRLELDAAHALAPRLKGDLLLSLGKPEAAREAFAYANARRKDLSSFGGPVDYRLASRRFREALGVSKQAFETVPNNARAIVLVGKVLATSDDKTDMAKRAPF
ncbi:hypothetical protein M885DRAFT_569331 [Pelagophyceae sp. CCMP2097]|nr:hypothetical protein M885DRAFT_569331 [Pelagophyceae sp. CCMP2097]